MNKIIYLKTGDIVKVSGSYNKLIFDKEWVHIETKDVSNRSRIEKSIPASNIKIIEDE
ncbi:MAG TPA: hypothetical protein VMW42_06435 [Desulfatiglandales bacterium]|nr:hypothetical protein [Desulfatiglandales bacterium]